MSNNAKNYKKGDRKRFMEMSFCVGVIPSNTFPLLNPHESAIQHTVKRWVKEGEYEEIKPEKNMRAIIPCKELRNKMLNKEAATLPFSPTLYEEFKTIGSKNIYTVNTKPTDKEFIRVIKVRKRRIYLTNESFIFLWGAGVNAMPVEKKPFTELSEENRQTLPVYYTSREITQISDDFISLTASDLKSKVITSSRMNGVVALKSGTFAVYNTGNNIIRFSNASESKGAIFAEVNSRRCGLADFRGCILLYHPARSGYTDATLQFLKPSKKNVLLSINNLTSAYPDQIFAIPLSPEGQDIIRIMNASSEWKEIILSMCLSEDLRRNTSLTAFDGYRKEEDGSISYYFVYLIPNIERLKKYAAFIKLTAEENSISEGRKNLFKIFCYPFQEGTLRKYLPENVMIKVVTTDQVKSWFAKKG